MQDEIAFCHLDSLKGSYRASVTEDFFIVEKPSGKQYHPRGFIKEIYLDNKKLLMPLVSGGVISSLSLVSIIAGMYNPWIVLITLCFGVAILYYGYRGKSFLIVNEIKNEGNYLLYESTANIKAFINYVNSEWLRKEDFHIYHICLKKEWEKQNGSDWYEHSSLSQEKFIHACLKEQLTGVIERFYAHQPDILILKIDPHKVASEIRFEKAMDVEDVFPHIYGRINKDSILEMQEPGAGQ